MSGPVVYGKQPFAGSLRAGHARPLPVHYLKGGFVGEGFIPPGQCVAAQTPRVVGADSLFTREHSDHRQAPREG